jgi:hypothetical protein
MATADATYTLGIALHLFQLRSREPEGMVEALYKNVNTRHKYGTTRCL